MTLKDLPNIEIAIIDNMETEPTGVRESGVSPIAPAICNAIFNATETYKVFAFK